MNINLFFCDSPIHDFDRCPREKAKGCGGCYYKNDPLKNKEKKVVSQFEFAIGNACDEKFSHTHRPRTDSEELELRHEKIQRTADQLKIKPSNNKEHDKMG